MSCHKQAACGSLATAGTRSKMQLNVLGFGALGTVKPSLKQDRLRSSDAQTLCKPWHG